MNASIEPTTAKTVLIMYTVFGDIVEKQAREVGISAVVSKSDQVSALISKIRNLLHPAAA